MAPKLCVAVAGEVIRPSRKFLNKEHQLRWMAAGGAVQMNRAQPLEAKQRGGAASGRMAVESGRLAEAGLKGAQRAREVADTLRSDDRRTA